MGYFFVISTSVKQVKCLELILIVPFAFGSCCCKPTSLSQSQHECWGKLLLKVMHYNIALLPKKVTNYVTKLLFMESNALRYFCVIFALLFNYEQGLIVFNTRSSIYSKCISPFTPKSVMNKPVV